MISQNASVTLKIIKKNNLIGNHLSGQLKHWFTMNTVNGSFKSGLEVSSIYSTNMAMHRNAKCNWTKIGENKTKWNNTQVTTATSVSHKKKADFSEWLVQMERLLKTAYCEWKWIYCRLRFQWGTTSHTSCQDAKQRCALLWSCI